VACNFVEHENIMPGWGCCSCRTYNGLHVSETVLFRPDGTVRFLHSDDLASLFGSVGTLTVRRASYVEPSEGGGWVADMGPSGGPVLGPYSTRLRALDEEREWLLARGIPSGV